MDGNYAIARVIWIIWCLLWAAFWAFTLIGIPLAIVSVALIWLPVGKPPAGPTVVTLASPPPPGQLDWEGWRRSGYELDQSH